MEVFEEIVMNYLVRQGDTFVSPQFNVRSADGKVWSCPDCVEVESLEKICFRWSPEWWKKKLSPEYQQEETDSEHSR